MTYNLPFHADRYAACELVVTQQERKTMALRHIEPSDFETVSPLLNDWWGGRPISCLLPRLFFEHFNTTSFIIEEERHLRGFLVGFQSQTASDVAYIHFIGVAPESRGQGYGRMLYEHFFGVVRSLGCTEVHSITSPVNEGSIHFHLHMGFQIVTGDGHINDVSVRLNHAGPGQHRVLFRKSFSGGKKVEENRQTDNNKSCRQ